MSGCRFRTEEVGPEDPLDGNKSNSFGTAGVVSLVTLVSLFHVGQTSARGFLPSGLQAPEGQV